MNYNKIFRDFQGVNQGEKVVKQIASLRCSSLTSGDSSKSAIVRLSLIILMMAREESFRVSVARFNSAFKIGMRWMY